MAVTRIALRGADPARFHQAVEQWRDIASGHALPKVAHRIVSILPKFLNRDLGYAFPTDETLAEILKATPRTIGRGMLALEQAGLIQRETMVKRDDKGEASGRVRRIFLALPLGCERTIFAREVNGHQVNGQPEVNGQNRASERTNVVRITSNKRTSDKKIHRHEKISVSAPAREGEPPVYRGDGDFLDAFDRAVVRMTDGKVIGAGEMERITQQAFDWTTDSSDLFMPVHWAQIVAPRRSSETADWFRRRVGQLVHRRAA